MTEAQAYACITCFDPPFRGTEITSRGPGKMSFAVRQRSIARNSKRHKRNLMATFSNWTLDDPLTNIPIFLSRKAMLPQNILCDSPVLVRLSVLLGAEGLRDAKSCRGTCVTTWSVHHAANCYRCAAVVWSVHLRGLLLQTSTGGVVSQSTQPVAVGAVVKQPGGQRTGSALLF